MIPTSLVALALLTLAFGGGAQSPPGLPSEADPCPVVDAAMDAAPEEAWTSCNMGPDSGLDADTVDGAHAADFFAADAALDLRTTDLESRAGDLEGFVNDGRYVGNAVTLGSDGSGRFAQGRTGMTLNHGSDSALFGLDLRSGDDASPVIAWGDDPDDDLIVRHIFNNRGGSDEVARFTGDSKVGIRTAHPQATLDVNGDVRFSGVLQEGDVPFARVTGDIPYGRLSDVPTGFSMHDDPVHVTGPNPFGWRWTFTTGDWGVPGDATVMAIQYEIEVTGGSSAYTEAAVYCNPGFENFDTGITVVKERAYGAGAKEYVTGIGFCPVKDGFMSTWTEGPLSLGTLKVVGYGR